MKQKTKEFIVATLGLSVSAIWITYTLFTAPITYTLKSYELARINGLLWFLYNMAGTAFFLTWHNSSQEGYAEDGLMTDQEKIEQLKAEIVELKETIEFLKTSANPLTVALMEMDEE